jgi:hypothetical protein
MVGLFCMSPKGMETSMKHASLKYAILLPLVAGSLAGQAVAAPAPACPSAAFPAFLAAYADSAALQRAFTDDPLAQTMLDHAGQGTPREITMQLPKSKLGFPLIPGRAERKRVGLVLRTDELAAGSARVSLLKEAAGYRVVYVFRKDACWKLERKEDHSL